MFFQYLIFNVIIWKNSFHFIALPFCVSQCYENKTNLKITHLILIVYVGISNTAFYLTHIFYNVISAI